MRRGRSYCSLAYSDLAAIRMGRLGSASFHKLHPFRGPRFSTMRKCEMVGPIELTVYGRIDRV